MSDAQATPPAEGPPEDLVLDLARDTLKGDIRDTLLKYQKELHDPLPWDARTEAKQREAIHNAEVRAEAILTKVVEIVRAGGREEVRLQVEYYVVKDEIKAVLKAPKSSHLANLLAGVVGQNVALVVCDQTPYEGQRKPAHVRKDQGDLVSLADTGDPTPPVPVEEKSKGKGKGKKGAEPPPPEPQPPEGEAKKPGPKDEPEVEAARKRKKDGGGEASPQP